MAIRVLVVDDSAVMRRAVSKLLESDERIEVVGRAKNGAEGVKLAETLKPDIVTLDVEMPEMDGLTALPKIKRVCSAHVVMCSSLTGEGSRAAIDAMRLGASDAIAKQMFGETPGAGRIDDALLGKVLALAGTSPPKRDQRSSDRVPDLGRSIGLVVVGSSTGGPPALEAFLHALGPATPFPVLIAQHMPRAFTESLAERLDAECPLPVLHADHRMPALPGRVYVAQGGRQMRVDRGPGGALRIGVSDEKVDSLYKPSINYLFESAAAAVGAETLAVVLTGMGEDGAAGAQVIKQAGGAVLAQSESTCVVYGMPKAVVTAGMHDGVASPEALGAAVARAAGRTSRRAG
ncbi:MAG: chemotaxis-specific protein-glutamate methyltransferase CheB [Planctomycetota bacterium]